MKKLSMILLGLFVSSALYANEGKSEEAHNHMGNHMHEGKMMNHSNMNGMTDEEMQKMHEKMMNEKVLEEKTKDSMNKDTKNAHEHHHN